MARKTMEVNGIMFEVLKPTSLPIMTRWDYEDLKDAYTSPSVYKQSVWDDWRLWFAEVYKAGKTDYWISGRNCFQFTISGYFEYNGKLWGVRITRDHNYIWEAI